MITARGDRLAVSIEVYKPNIQCDGLEAPVKYFGPMGPVRTILKQMCVQICMGFSESRFFEC